MKRAVWGAPLPASEGVERHTIRRSCRAFCAIEHSQLDRWRTGCARCWRRAGQHRSTADTEHKDDDERRRDGPRHTSRTDHRAERKHIGAHIHRLSIRLLGRHVGGGPHDHTGRCHGRRGRCRLSRREGLGGFPSQQLCETEVEHLRFCDDGLERSAVDVLHRNERHIAGAVDVVDVDDVRVVECGGGLGFLDKAALPIWVRARVRREDLDGDGAVQARVDRAIHGTQAAFADLGDKRVVRELLALHGAQLWTDCRAES